MIGFLHGERVPPSESLGRGGPWRVIRQRDVEEFLHVFGAGRTHRTPSVVGDHSSFWILSRCARSRKLSAVQAEAQTLATRLFAPASIPPLGG